MAGVFSKAKMRAKALKRTLTRGMSAPVDVSKVEKYVFIVTYGRSGSTLLQSILGQTPGFHISGENYNALSGLHATYRSAKSTKEDQGQVVRPLDHPWYGAFDVQPERYGAQLAELFVKEILNPPAEARVVGFKGIRWFHEPDALGDMLEFVSTHFAPARFVFNTRDPEKVAGSSWWADLDRSDVVARVQGWNELADTLVRQRPEEAYLVRHEEYVEDPSVLRGLFDFLGEPFDRARIEATLAKKLEH